MASSFHPYRKPGLVQRGRPSVIRSTLQRDETTDDGLPYSGGSVTTTVRANPKQRSKRLYLSGSEAGPSSAIPSTIKSLAGTKGEPIILDTDDLTERRRQQPSQVASSSGSLEERRLQSPTTNAHTVDQRATVPLNPQTPPIMVASNIDTLPSTLRIAQGPTATHRSRSSQLATGNNTSPHQVIPNPQRAYYAAPSQAKRVRFAVRSPPLLIFLSSLILF